jgi:oligopeptide transport system substrate-binding protein
MAFSTRAGSLSVHQVAAIPAIAALFLLLLSTACRQQSDYLGKIEAPSENVFRFINGAEPEYLDPGMITANTDERIASLMFEGLLKKDPKTLESVAGIATRWERSPDGLTYTFYLRSDILWSDGRRVTAHDFVYSWTRVLDPQTASPFSSIVYPIRNGERFNKGELKDPTQLGVRALDDFTLVVELENPLPYFLHLVSNFTFYPVPRWVVEEYGDKWTRPENVVGNGAFLLTEHRTNDRIVLERNPLYYDAEKVRLDRIIAYPVVDVYTAVNLYEAGYVDWVVGNSVPPEFTPYMKDRYRDFFSYPQVASYYYAFNVTRPPLDNRLVRQALAMAIDRRSLTDDLLRGGQIPGPNFVPLGLQGYESPPGLEYNPARAAELLAEAGYPNGQGFPELEVTFNTLAAHRKIAETIQQMWAVNLNISIRLHNEEWAAFLKSRQNLEHEIARAGWIADFPDPAAFLDLLETGNANNDSGWSNEGYDRLMTASRKETDPTQRYDLMRQAEAILLEEVPVMPLYTYGVNSLKKPYVKGIHLNSMDLHPLTKVCIDRDWRERSGPEDAACD